METDDSDLFNNEELEALMGFFLDQAAGLLDTANQTLLRLEANSDDTESLSQLQRALHTLKGDANSVGFSELGTIAHRLEDLLSLRNQHGPALDQQIFDLMLFGLDSLGEMLQSKKQWVHAPLDILPTTYRIDEFISRHSEPEKAVVRALPTTIQLNEYQTLRVQSAAEEGFQVLQIEARFDNDCPMHAAGALIILRQLRQLGEVVATFPDLNDDPSMEEANHITVVLLTDKPEAVQSAALVAGVSSQAMIETLKIDSTRGVVENKPLAAPAKDLGAMLSTGGVASDGAEAQPRVRTLKDTVTVSAEILRVSAAKVDALMDLVGELVISRSMLNQIAQQLKNEFPKHPQISRLTDTDAYLGRVIGDLQKNVLQVRMVTLDQTFNRFFRVVRDLARESAKQVELEIIGEETELDKRVVDIIYEPLLHLVRNAVDHGIETAEQRLAAGKAPQGRLALRAYHQTDQVIIEVEDDGRGIDIVKLKQRVVEKGLRTAEEVAALTGQDAIDLIFLSGLSTADQITEVSGRGVGMDVVRRVLENLKGGIEISSELGRGTRFRLNLPLTLAIIKSMLFTIGTRVFAIPLSVVVEIARGHRQQIKQIGRHKLFNLRETLYSLVELDQMLLPADQMRDQTEDEYDEYHNAPFILLVGFGDRRAGLIVDRVIGEREMVVKAVDKEWISSELITGASILGDGRVVLILDVGALLRRAGATTMSAKI